jgi:hypothetical protein
LFNGFQTSEKILAVFLLCCSHLVLTFELASLMGGLDNQFLILLIQAILVMVAILLNRILKLGFPLISFPRLEINLQSIVDLMKRNMTTVMFFFIILSTYIFLAYIQFRFPQNTTDSLLNHLSRIGHWLQQGSLKPYIGFNNFGSSFPFNSSLLMLWSIVFLRSDRLVGYVQFVAAIMTAITIFSLGNEFSFNRKASFLASLFFLTFPIVLFQSITAQNDLLAAGFLIIAMFFLIRSIHASNRICLALSILSFALAVGTKQYALFALPGYGILIVFMLWKHRSNIKAVLVNTALFTISFTLLFSSYSYIQNWLVYGNPVGGQNTLELIQPQPSVKDSLAKVAVNSLRLTYQFLDCEGIPPILETACTKAKTSILKPLLVNSIINVESSSYLLDEGEPFALSKKYALNEESSWYGIVGCLLIFLSIPLGLITSLKDRRMEGVILVLSAIIFFLITSSVKSGWDPYVGRYLIFSTVLLLPFCAGSLVGKKWMHKIFLRIMGAVSIFIMIYSVLNNDSRPLIGSTEFLNIQLFGKENLITKQITPYRMTQLIRHEKTLWAASDEQVKTFANDLIEIPLLMVEEFVPENSTLGILSPPGYTFPDYLFFGNSLSRRLVIFTNLQELLADHLKMDFLLVSPDFQTSEFPGFGLLDSDAYWQLFQKISDN